MIHKKLKRKEKEEVLFFSYEPKSKVIFNQIVGEIKKKERAFLSIDLQDKTRQDSTFIVMMVHPKDRINKLADDFFDQILHFNEVKNSD
jgi:hypothetical protein